jgi:ribosomal protein L37AE/L43A
MVTAGMLVIGIAVWLLLLVSRVHQEMGAIYSTNIPRANVLLAYQLPTEEWRLVDDQEISADEFTNLYSAPKASRVYLIVPYKIEGFPFVHLTNSLDVRIKPLSNWLTLTPSELEAIRSAYLQRPDIESKLTKLGFAKPWPIAAPTHRLDLWRTMSLTTWCVLTLAIPWLFVRTITLARRLHRHRRDHERLAAGLCPRCQYDLTTQLAVGIDRCPECGFEIQTTATQKSLTPESPTGNPPKPHAQE